MFPSWLDNKIVNTETQIGTYMNKEFRGSFYRHQKTLRYWQTAGKRWHTFRGKGNCSCNWVVFPLQYLPILSSVWKVLRAFFHRAKVSKSSKYILHRADSLTKQEAVCWVVLLLNNCAFVYIGSKGLERVLTWSKSRSSKNNGKSHGQPRKNQD